MLDIPESIKSLFKADNITKDTQRHLKLYFYNEDVQLLFPEESLYPSDELFPIDQEPCYVIDNEQVLTEALTITESFLTFSSYFFSTCIK